MSSENAQNQFFQQNLQIEGGYRRRVVVKFADFVQLPYEDGVEDYIRRYGIGPWDELSQNFPGITLKRLYASVKPEEIRRLVDQAMAVDETYDPPNFLTYFVIDVPPDIDPEKLAEALLAWENVENAYVESKPAPPPAVPTGLNPLLADQGYLDPARTGIDAEYAWTFPGGSGDNIQFIDLERGWTLTHEDLAGATGMPGPGVTLIPGGENEDEFRHGTSVLGIVVAVDNAVGCVGIARGALAGVISGWRTPVMPAASPTWNLPDAIMSALPVLAFGDVFLLEVQIERSGVFLPVELETANFDSIRLATALGIAVVEAAANRGVELDTQPDVAGHYILNRTSSDFKDSGAIMVGAASRIEPHRRLNSSNVGESDCWAPPVNFSNYGSRVDCYAWGECVRTTDTNASGTGTTQYSSIFSGTSSAAAIIAGAALVVQGVAEQNPPNRRFSSYQLRAILSDPANGTRSQNPPVDCIGVMPDLRKIIDCALGLAPDVYIRDFVGDIGEPHMGPISASPDIILRPTPVADPVTEFGPLSGTENDSTLGSEAESGQDNFVYVRVRNRGGSVVSNVVCTVYWSPVATLVTPDLWTLVGSVTIPNVLNGNVLTASDAIVWPAAEIPATGHYCFVGLVGHAADPAPNPVDFLDFDNFFRFVRDNNNVTWRNFNVVDNVPPPPPSGGPSAVPLPFLAAGAPDKARNMRLEVMTMLPQGARAWLEGPSHWMEAWQGNKLFLEVDEKRGVARLPINPHGLNRFAEVLFPVKLRAEMTLLVDIPAELRENAYEVFIRQLYQEEEVGRITWRLAPRKREKDSN
jgi:serine protease